MTDDALKEARDALQRAQRALGSAAGENAALFAEIARSLEAGFDRVEALRREVSEAERNLASQLALLDERLLRVEHNRVFTLWNSVVGSVQNVLHGWRRVLRGSSGGAPRQQTIRADYAKWIAHEQAALPSADTARAIADGWPRRPRISLVLPVTRERGLAEALASVENQVYPNWELCLAVSKSCAGSALPLLEAFEAKRPEAVRRVVVESVDLAASLRAGAALATGDYLSFLGEGVVLTPLALHFIAEAAQSADFDLLYADEDALDAEGRRVDPLFKPGWSPALLTSCMYLGRCLTVRREALERHPFRSGYAGAELHDLALRASDPPARVRHIARVLFHSGSADRGEPCGDGAASARAIEETILRREGVAAECVPGPPGAGLRIRRKSPSAAATAIVCSRSPELLRRCLRSLRATAQGAIAQVIVVAHEEAGPLPALRRVIEEAGGAIVSFGGPFNFSAMNNLGAELARTPNLLFLNDDVEASAGGWAEALNEEASRETVGAAGATLWYPSGVLQHAGLVVGAADGVGHLGRYAASSDLWPWLRMTREVSAVTGACLAMRTGLFRELGGFDIGFPNNYNDVDLCFRVRERGLSVVCVAVPGLVHRECQTRRGIVRFAERYRFYRRWGALLSAPDPYYSPALAPAEEIALDLNPGPASPFAG